MRTKQHMPNQTKPTEEQKEDNQEGELESEQSLSNRIEALLGEYNELKQEQKQAEESGDRGAWFRTISDIQMLVEELQREGLNVNELQHNESQNSTVENNAYNSEHADSIEEINELDEGFFMKGFETYEKEH